MTQEGCTLIPGLHHYQGNALELLYLTCSLLHSGRHPLASWQKYLDFIKIQSLLIPSLLYMRRDSSPWSFSYLIKNRLGLDRSKCSKITVYNVSLRVYPFPGAFGSLSAPSPCSQHRSSAKSPMVSWSWTLRWVFLHISGANSLPWSQVLAPRPSVWVMPQSAMEPGPALAWLLLLSLLADCLKAAQSRDFTVKDIVYLHPSSKTLFSLLQKCHFTLNKMWVEKWTGELSLLSPAFCRRNIGWLNWGVQVLPKMLYVLPPPFYRVLFFISRQIVKACFLCSQNTLILNTLPFNLCQLSNQLSKWTGMSQDGGVCQRSVLCRQDNNWSSCLCIWFSISAWLASHNFLVPIPFGFLCSRII